MKVPDKAKEEGLLDYAERLSELYAGSSDARVRKLKGQFFTPKQVGAFMAGLFEVPRGTVRLLDPGAGTGVLTAAFCERLLSSDEIVDLTVDVYENEPAFLPFLEAVMKSCKEELEEREHSFGFNIYVRDFILSNSRYFRKTDLLRGGEKSVLYDFVISNPPYYKLNKDSPQSEAIMELVSGQPNIYALFMAVSASMVKLGGEMVFISPRSFCSGLYYKKFREWFLDNVRIKNVHIFESRKGIFDRDEVLQENIILKAKKLNRVSEHEKGNVIVSISENKDFSQLRKIEVPYADVICSRNGALFIRIPSSALDVDILHIVDKWSNTLEELGLEISTGPVVPFRAEEYLLPELTKKPDSAPLLWMHNMQDMRVVWPLKKNEKASAIRVCAGTAPLLLPVKNYVLVKRFSSKEQKRRLYVAVLLESDFPYETVGIENHVNYIHRPNGNLSEHEAFGIAAILNTTVVDSYFRSLNGNTQVNASDIRNLPFPSIGEIKEIGKLVYESQSYRNGFNLDNIVAGVLGINSEIIKNLNKGETKNGQS